MTSLWQRRLAIEKDRREKMRQAMWEYDADVYNPAMKALREECEASTGHTWIFSGIGPLGDPWEICNTCQKSRRKPG